MALMAEREVSRPHQLSHRIIPMSGRNPDEEHRQATPLELLFDLTFVVAFGIAGEEFAHMYAEGHYGAGLVAFSFAAFAVIWAWISYTWFASAYDTEDWVFRLLTMLQMVGVLVLALGLPQMFHAVDEGEVLGNQVMVGGYVVMRVAMVAQWLRAARNDAVHRAACRTYAVTIALAQVGWVGLVALQLPLAPTLLLGLLLIAFELASPWFAQRHRGGTPWHHQHIAERYGLFTIITLGEGVIGTVASLSAVVDEQGWSVDAGLVAVAGTGLTFGLWWTYFIVPSAKVLRVHRERSFVWGYGHIPLFAALAAAGAGLHVAAYYIEGVAHIGVVATVLSMAIPVAIFVAGLYAVHTYLLQAVDPLHSGLLLGTAAVLVLAVTLAGAGVSMAVSLLVLSLAPVVTVVGYETVGHRHLDAILHRMHIER
jgi:low temperature requirement protein LtrA